MFIEEQELNDWNIYPYDDNEIRKQKSISAYCLHNWYDKMKEHTFKTIIYKSIEEIQSILPFEKCMIRYENKSPKDSEFWGPVSTKKELEKIFFTSLRCKTNPGQYYCIREWIELGDEYRCFWNNGLVAISSETTYEPPFKQIFEYIKIIKKNIHFHRCVFDIAHIKDTNELIFIEYNSWESNSGAHKFDWNNDKEIFYCSENIVIRYNGGELRINNELNTNKIMPSCTKFIMNNELYEFVQLNYPLSYLITEKYIYISNDIWLGRFDHNLNPINWQSGVFRFCNIELCTDGCICANDKYYYYDLTPKFVIGSTRILKTVTNSQEIDIVYKSDNLINFKYGIHIKNKETSQILFIRMLDSGELVY